MQERLHTRTRPARRNESGKRSDEAKMQPTTLIKPRLLVCAFSWRESHSPLFPFAIMISHGWKFVSKRTWQALSQLINGHMSVVSNCIERSAERHQHSRYRIYEEGRCGGVDTGRGWQLERTAQCWRHYLLSLRSALIPTTYILRRSFFTFCSKPEIRTRKICRGAREESLVRVHCFSAVVRGSDAVRLYVITWSAAVHVESAVTLVYPCVLVWVCVCVWDPGSQSWTGVWQSTPMKI